MRRKVTLWMLAVVLVSGGWQVARASGSYIGGLTQVGTVSTTVPGNGDINPYGVARVPVTMGKLVAGNILISNFNGSSNFQGTGTTIVQISPGGAMAQFAQLDAGSLPNLCPGGVGLTTALVALRSGFVVVGSLPTSDGTAATAQRGCLIVLDSNGNPVDTIFGNLINGPWDMTAVDGGTAAALFVTNVLNGTVAANGAMAHGGTVLRIVLSIPNSQNPRVTSEVVVGSGFAERTDAAAMVIGPTGVALDADHDLLYVNDSLANRTAVILNPLTRGSSAGRGVTVSVGGHLNDPLGMAMAPNGDILTVNGDDGYIVETTPGGVQVAAELIDSSGSPPGSGALFGLIVVPGQGVYFVDDATNTLDLLH